MKHLRSCIATCAMWLCIAAAHAQGVRPEVGKPLQQASDLLKAGKAKEALAKVREADAVSGKTPAEQLMIDRMKGAAAQRAGDNATAIQAFEAVFNSGKLSGAEQAQVAESLAFAYSQQKDWPRTNQWVQRAIAAGSTSAQLKQLQAYAQSQSGDYSAIAKEAQAAVAAAEQAGRKPDEGDLLRLADAQQRTGNTQGTSRHARQAARQLPEEGVLVDPARPAAAQERLLRPLLARPVSAAPGHRQPDQDRRLHGDGSARAAGGLPGRRQGGDRQGLRVGSTGHWR